MLAEPYRSGRVTAEIPKLGVDKRITAKARLLAAMDFSYIGRYISWMLSPGMWMLFMFTKSCKS